MLESASPTEPLGHAAPADGMTDGGPSASAREPRTDPGGVAPPTRQRPRLYFLDNLRAFVIVLVIVLHASITYMAVRAGVVVRHRPRPQRRVHAARPRRRRPAHARPLLRGRVLRAPLARAPRAERVRPGEGRAPGDPLGFAVVFLAPLATYVTYVSRDVPMGYLEFWTTDFWGPMFQQSVYWFLGVLFALFVVLVWAYAPEPAAARRGAVESSSPDRACSSAFIALTARGSVLASPYFGLDDWRPLSSPVRRAAGADRFLRRLLHARGSTRIGTAGSRDRLPTGARAVGRGLRPGRRRLPRRADGRPGRDVAAQAVETRSSAPSA